MIDPSIESLREPQRRFMLKGAALLALGIAAVRTPKHAAAAPAEPVMPNPMPTQVPVKEGVAALPGTRLYYWDTGGGGPALVLLHPAAASRPITRCRIPNGC